MVETKVDENIWCQEAEKFKNACKKLNRQIKCTDLKNNFMGLRCHSWYYENAPAYLGMTKYSDFIKYLGKDAFYIERPTKKFVVEYVKELYQKLGRSVKLSDFAEGSPVLKKDIYYYFGSINKMNEKLGFPKSGSYTGHIYTKDELISSLQSFVSKHGFIPTSLFVEKYGKDYGLPNRKTYNNKFGNWTNVLHKCGYDDELKRLNYTQNKDGVYVLQHNNKDFLKSLILEYIDEFNKIPTIDEISECYGTDIHTSYIKHFGGWNNCLELLGLKLNSKVQYTQEELDFYFIDFINKHKRVPTIRDFNKTDRPSFWVYQQRFGSWAETCIHYGYKPNCRKPEYYMEDGERCDSSYEYDISTWLKSHNISYKRDISYVDFTNNYQGKMNCDYLINVNGNLWYVEMAGFVKSLYFNDTTSEEERMYLRKLKYKIKLFEENNIKNYKIIFRKDIEEKSLEEIFDFLEVE